jgi:hypothetical protein
LISFATLITEAASAMMVSIGLDLEKAQVGRTGLSGKNRQIETEALKHNRTDAGTGGVMATRESNVIMFPQPIDPERKEDVRLAEQFFEKVDGLVMEGLQRDLAAAEARGLDGRCGRCGGCRIFVPFDQTPAPRS